MKIFLMIFLLITSSCGILVLPQDPAHSQSEYECANKCAAIGMKGVFVGGKCGCEKK